MLGFTIVRPLRENF